MCRMYQQINIWQYSGHLFGKATQADIIAYSRLVYLKLIIISQTAFAKQQAEGIRLLCNNLLGPWEPLDRARANGSPSG